MNIHGDLLSFVLIAGLLGSFNPCAIAILLLFLGMMFTLRKSRKSIIIMGSAYIISVYLTFLGIGIGLLRVVNVFSIPHLITKIGAWILIFLGLLGLKEQFLPDKYNFLTIPLSARQLIGQWAMKATLPAAVVAGFFVGITEFPCAGPIYLATISLLNSKATFLKGILYLLLYNFMFVLPLIIIFVVATNRFIAERLINLDEKYAKAMRIFTASVMIIIGIIILIWFV